LAPIASQVRALTLVDAKGDLRRCDRERNSELFSLVLGGYGLFGAIASVKLELTPRVELCRRVVLTHTETLMEEFAERRAAGFTYGDFQFAVDPESDDFLRKGVFSCYQPVLQEGPPRSEQRRLGHEQWKHLLHLAHVDKGRAFEEYSNYYLRTDGQRYCSDTHQLATYLDGYHAELDAELGHEGSEVISELHVPRERFAEFMAQAAAFTREARADVIYGTVRLIEQDGDSFLAWAREPWACIVLNLHVEHEPQAIEAAGEHFRGLYDIALDLGGSFYLTYHSWANRSQLLRGHPRLPEFLKAKQRMDPKGRFRSDWHKKLLRTLRSTRE
jgi:FAD/FMN-containing dehydrogenase